MDDLLSDNDSIDYSLTEQQTTAQIEVQQPTTEPLDTEETSNSSPDSATDSSLDTASIEVIQPSIEGLEIRRPDNTPPRVPLTTPQSPRSNVAADISGLLTEDEEPDQVVPPTICLPPLESQGRKETLSPTPNREKYCTLRNRISSRRFTNIRATYLR